MTICTPCSLCTGSIQFSSLNDQAEGIASFGSDAFITELASTTPKKATALTVDPAHLQTFLCIGDLLARKYVGTSVWFAQLPLKFRLLWLELPALWAA